MNNIKNFNSITNKKSDWNFNNVAFIEEINYKKNEITDDSELVIVFSGSERNKSSEWPNKIDQKIIIKFVDITDMQLDLSKSLPIQIMGFDIEDITEKNWDNCNYRISDYENGSIEFNCREIEIINFDIK